MLIRFFILSLFSIQFLTACGGGGGGGGDEASPQAVSPDGVILKDTDDLPKDGAIGQLALTSSEVENSVCFAELPSFRDLNDSYFNKALEAPTEDIYFNYVMGEDQFGSIESEISFLGQNKEVYDILSALLFNVKQVSTNGQPPVFGVSNNKPVYNEIRSFCRDIQCAADSIFFDSWGLRFLFKEKFGIILSGHVDPNTEEFSDDQFLYSVAQAVLSLPKGTFPLNKANFIPNMQEFAAQNMIIAPYMTGRVPTQGSESAAGVTLSSRSGSSADASMLTNVDVYLLDPWKQTRDFHSRLYTIFHELIHVLDQAKEGQKVLSTSEDWLKISDWRFNSGNQTWVMVKDNLKCSEYGSTLPQEDFAECGSLYRFAPNRLRKISRAKYNFFKNRVFNGIEYNELSKCRSAIETF